MNDPEEADPHTGTRPSNWILVGDDYAPAAPEDVRQAGVEAADLCDLALRAAHAVPQFTTEWAAQRLHLPQPLAGELLERLRGDLLLDILGQAGPFGFRYSISGRGRERVGRLLEISGYVGPAPVSLAAYTEALTWQLGRAPGVSPDLVREALAGLVLPSEAARLAGLAAASGRSLFLFGPPGNGKSTLGRMLHETLSGFLWIPHCIEVEGTVIRLFDAHCHQPAEVPPEYRWMIDRRWIRIHRPLVIVGGEMTIDSLDLAYSPPLRCYEAPLHLKANGGTLLVDDFGRQRVDPTQLLNRWIIPLEHRIDYLTLRTGQKIQVPLIQMLIIATNLSLADVTDPAFLRRMGYRLYLGEPSPELYRRIFERYADEVGLAIPAGLMERLLGHYRREGRELRCCEPRDLIERALDLCRFEGRPPGLDNEILDLAWTGYFGDRPSEA